MNLTLAARVLQEPRQRKHLQVRCGPGFSAIHEVRRCFSRSCEGLVRGLPRYEFERQTIVERVGATAQSFGRTPIAAADLNEFLCGQSFVNHL